MSADTLNEMTLAALAVRYGSSIRFLDEVTSTNDLALEWIESGAPEGGVVLANVQTQGRGRLGRTWQTETGAALLMTMIICPPPADVGRVVMLGAVAVAQTLKRLGVEGIGIKWPNDVQVNRLKVCGILPEVRWQTEQPAVALGIGLNVRGDFRGTPLDGKATSIEAELSNTVDRLVVLEALLDALTQWRAQIASKTLFEAWRSRLTMLGEQVSVVQGSEAVQGIAESVDESGALWIRKDDRQRVRVLAGDITGVLA